VCVSVGLPSIHILLSFVHSFVFLVSKNETHVERFKFRLYRVCPPLRQTDRQTDRGTTNERTSERANERAKNDEQCVRENWVGCRRDDDDDEEKGEEEGKKRNTARTHSRFIVYSRLTISIITTTTAAYTDLIGQRIRVVRFRLQFDDTCVSAGPIVPSVGRKPSRRRSFGLSEPAASRAYALIVSCSHPSLFRPTRKYVNESGRTRSCVFNEHARRSIDFVCVSSIDSLSRDRNQMLMC
jgi:hypothetical protein